MHIPTLYDYHIPDFLYQKSNKMIPDFKVLDPRSGIQVQNLGSGSRIWIQDLDQGSGSEFWIRDLDPD